MRTLTPRRIAFYGLGLTVGLAVLGYAALVASGPFDMAEMVARRESDALGRRLTIASMNVHVGTSVMVEMHDLSVDSPPGGGRPPMLSITRLDGEIAPWSLVSWAVTNRALAFRHLSADGVKLLLEHGPGDRPGWHFEGPRTRPANWRVAMPTLLDARLNNAEIDLQTSSGKVLRITVNDFTIATDSASEPVTLTGAGAYNGTPIILAATLHSFNELRDAEVPFGTGIHLSSGTSTLDFTGTMTDPLNVDGADGRLSLNAPNWDRLLAIEGVGGQLDLPLVLSGTMKRQGDVWRLTQVNGTLRGHPLQASAELHEGARHAPDAITLDANLSVLDLTGLSGPSKPVELSLRIDSDPGTLLDAHVTAKQFVRGDFRAEAVDLKANLAPGSLVIEPLTLRLAGGAARIDAAIENTKSSVVTRFDASVTGAGVGPFAGLLGVGALPLAGGIDARAQLQLTGATLAEASRTNRGVLLLSMHNGSIDRKIIEGASTDLRLLFRPAVGTGQITCLLGVIDVRNSSGLIAPLRIRTPDGTIAATGTLDIPNGTIDVIVASEAASTGLFALDVPLRIAGPIDDPHVTPALGNTAGAASATAGPREIPPALRDFVRDNPCLTGGRH